MNSNRLAIAFLGVSIHTIVLSANIDNVISSLPIFILPLLLFCVCVVFFFFFITLARASNRTLNRSADIGLPCLFSELREKHSLFYHIYYVCIKAGLKFNIQKMKIVASGPITSWQIDGETMETVGSKITADGHCSHEIQRHLLLG